VINKRSKYSENQKSVLAGRRSAQDSHDNRTMPIVVFILFFPFLSLLLFFFFLEIQSVVILWSFSPSTYIIQAAMHAIYNCCNSFYFKWRKSCENSRRNQRKDVILVLLQISGAVVSVFSSYFIYQLHEYLALTPDNVYGPPAILVAVGIVTCGIGWFAWQFMNFSNRGQVIIVSRFLSNFIKRYSKFSVIMLFICLCPVYCDLGDYRADRNRCRDLGFGAT